MKSYNSSPANFSSFNNPRKGIDILMLLDQTWASIMNSSSDNIGFNAHLSGWRTYHGKFDGLGHQTGWWSSTEEKREYNERGFYYNRFIYIDIDSIVRASCHTRCCLSVRCIKDN